MAYVIVQDQSPLYLPDGKKKMPFAATWVSPEIIILSAISQREMQISHDITYTQDQKKKININLFIKQKQAQYGHRKQIDGYHRESRRKDKLEG